MFYAKIDHTTTKRNPSFGFVNSKTAIAFETKNARDEYVDERSVYDFSCKAISAKEALKYRHELPDGTKGLYIGDYISDVWHTFGRQSIYA
jgi:hypothetical protein